MASLADIIQSAATLAEPRSERRGGEGGTAWQTAVTRSEVGYGRYDIMPISDNSGWRSYSSQRWVGAIPKLSAYSVEIP